MISALKKFQFIKIGINFNIKYKKKLMKIVKFRFFKEGGFYFEFQKLIFEKKNFFQDEFRFWKMKFRDQISSYD